MTLNRFSILTLADDSGSEDSWFYIWKTEPSNMSNTNGTTTKLTRKQRRHFDRAFERIRGKYSLSKDLSQKHSSFQFIIPWSHPLYLPLIPFKLWIIFIPLILLYQLTISH